MSTLLYILVFGFLMSCIALVGSLTLVLPQGLLNQLILPLISFAAGSLIGGAMFHMIPAAVEQMGNVTALYAWLAGGFVLFFALEQFLNWHHSHTHSHSCSPLSPPHQHALCSDRDPTHVYGLDCELATNFESTQVTDVSAIRTTQNLSEDTGIELGRAATQNDPASSNPTDLAATADRDSHPVRKQPLTYLILIADTVHNFLGGMFVGASFVDSTQLGISAWLAAAAHEIPQEFGDYAILVHGGWSTSRALLFNFLSALTFPLGGVLAYAASTSFQVAFLIPFAAGNFLYIAGSDLIPEVKHYHGLRTNLVHFLSFLAGIGIMLGIRVAFEGW